MILNNNLTKVQFLNISNLRIKFSHYFAQFLYLINFWVNNENIISGQQIISFLKPFITVWLQITFLHLQPDYCTWAFIFEKFKYFWRAAIISSFLYKPIGQCPGGPKINLLGMGSHHYTTMEWTKKLQNGQWEEPNYSYSKKSSKICII